MAGLAGREKNDRGHEKGDIRRKLTDMRNAVRRRGTRALTGGHAHGIQGRMFVLKRHSAAVW